MTAADVSTLDLLIALGSLTETQRWVFVDVHLHDRTFTEVAAELGVSKQRACQIDQQAGKLLREALAREERCEGQAPGREGVSEAVPSSP